MEDRKFRPILFRTIIERIFISNLTDIKNVYNTRAMNAFIVANRNLNKVMCVYPHVMVSFIKLQNF